MSRQILVRYLGAGDKTVVVIMQNPNTADDIKNDHSTTKLTNFFRRLGYSKLTILNLFTVRSNHPNQLRGCCDPIGDNDFAALKDATLIVYGWGKVPAFLKSNYAWNAQEPNFLKQTVQYPFCFGVNLNGSPSHPARIVMDLIPFRPASSTALTELKRIKEMKKAAATKIELIL
jgi:hypothetical protein